MMAEQNSLIAVGTGTGTSGAVDRSSIATLPATRKRILTGIRPTGPLHLGHYAGALENWLKLQNEYDCYFLIADYQFADHAQDLARVRNAVWEVALDWLAVGLDPERASFVIESGVPEHTELTTWLAWFLPIGMHTELTTWLAWFLRDSADVVAKKVRVMYAGPPRGANEPGEVEADPVFGYLDAFDNDAAEVSDLKERYEVHGVSNAELKDRLTQVLNELLEPIRQRRAQYEGNMVRVREALEHGTGRARVIARETMERVHDALDLGYLRKYK